MTRPSQGIWYSGVAILISILLVTVTTVVLLDRSATEAKRAAAEAARESERKWCAVIITMDEAYRIAPPATAISRKLAHDIGVLREKFDCPDQVPS